MDITVTVDDSSPRAKALAKAVEAYNSRNPFLSREEFVQKMLGAQLDSLVASYMTTTVSKLAFLDRFTPAERIAIREAGKTDGVVNDYLELLSAASEVDLTSARTTGGVAALEAAGLIAQGRGAEILAL